jgi:hypothetical protein
MSEPIKPAVTFDLDALRGSSGKGPRWWLSFCDASRPEGTQFIGAAVVRGVSLDDAVRRAWAVGCNPGGEVMAFELPEEMGTEWDAIFAGTPLDTLMDRAALAKLGHEPQSLAELPDEVADAILGGSQGACEKCVEEQEGLG